MANAAFFLGGGGGGSAPPATAFGWFDGATHYGDVSSGIHTKLSVANAWTVDCEFYLPSVPVENAVIWSTAVDTNSRVGFIVAPDGMCAGVVWDGGNNRVGWDAAFAPVVGAWNTLHVDWAITAFGACTLNGNASNTIMSITNSATPGFRLGHRSEGDFKWYGGLRNVSINSGENILKLDDGSGTTFADSGTPGGAPGVLTSGDPATFWKTEIP